MPKRELWCTLLERIPKAIRSELTGIAAGVDRSKVRRSFWALIDRKRRRAETTHIDFDSPLTSGAKIAASLLASAVDKW